MAHQARCVAGVAHAVAVVGTLLLLGIDVPHVATAPATSTPYEYTDAEVGEAAAKQLEAMLAPLRAQGLVLAPDAVDARLRRVFDGVVRSAASARASIAALELVIVAHRIPHASASASGKVVVSTGFLTNYLPNDDELAFVFAHEIAHVLCDHERMQLSAVWRQNAPQRLKAAYALEFLETEPQVRQRIATLARQHERVADRAGLAIAARAGYDPRRAIRYFEKTASQAAWPLVVTPHDASETRQAALEPLASRFAARWRLSPSCEPANPERADRASRLK